MKLAAPWRLWNFPLNGVTAFEACRLFEDVKSIRCRAGKYFVKKNKYKKYKLFKKCTEIMLRT